MDKTSMCFWWDKVKDLGIPTPKTVIVPFDEPTQKAYWCADEANLLHRVMVNAIKEQIVEYPVFIRTDQSSAKHSWVESCFVKDEGSLRHNLFNILEFNLCCDLVGLPATAFVIREYIPMAEVFKAFYNMPVNPERRYFVNDGKVICHHAYWIQDAIETARHSTTLPSNWKVILAEINKEKEDEVILLTKYANTIAKVLSGFWSIDFCKAKDGTWYFIDMAVGEKSWHPSDCENSR